MTVPSTRFREDYAGNGSATSFPYAFRIFKSTDLVVTKTDSSGNDTTLTLGTDYTVTGAGSYNGGAVVLTAALPTSYRLTIERVLAIKQETDLRNQGEFLAETHEDAFDRLTMIVQRLAGYLGMGQGGTLRTLLLGTGDVDGAGAFDARSNRIKNLSDPIDNQDASSKIWTLNTIAASITAGNGNAVLQLLADNDQDKGAAKVYGAVRTVNSISDINGENFFDGTLIYAKGRLASGDGGGGFFKYVAGSIQTADDGLVFSVPGGRIFRDGWTVFGFKGRIRAAWFGAKPDFDGTTGTPSGAAINAAINACTAISGAVDLEQGFYLCEVPVQMKRNVGLYGMGSRRPGADYDGATVLYGKHSGSAVLSLAGQHCCRIVGFMTYGDPSITPKTGLLLGRTSSDSSGLHYIERVHADGYYTKAAIYSIASESNVWVQPAYTLRGGGALYGFYTSQGDDLGVGGLVGSSNLENTVTGMEGINMVDNTSASGIFINGGAGTGAWTFIGCYPIQYKGSYITIQAGSADGQDIVGSITFKGGGGEIYDKGDGTSPHTGFNLLGSTAIRGLDIGSYRFQFKAAVGTERSIRQASTLSLKQPNISLPVMDNAVPELVFSKIFDGRISVGPQTITNATLQNGWTSSLAIGNGIKPPGYYRDPEGFVNLVGVANGGTMGLAVFTLPDGYKPAVNEIFTALNGSTTVVRVDVKADGTVVANSSGSNAYVSFSGIRFKAA